MNIDQWLEAAYADADRRGLPDLKPLLATLASATRVLRAADWNDLPRPAAGPEPAVRNQESWTR